MAVKTVYLPDPPIQHNHLRISGDEHRHLVVARAEPDEVIEIFDGKGMVWTGTVLSAGKRETDVLVTGWRKVDRHPLELILALAMIRTAAFELALEKVVEVGVTRIVPFTADRSNAGRADRQDRRHDRRHDRWMRMIIEAAKQSKQYHLPALDEPATLDQVLSIPAASKILFAEHDGGPLKSALAGSPVLYLIGPEGGWTDRELAAARDRGFHLVSLGEAILKAETAAIVGASLIRYELG
jgi:16S rRNA (uracil1498-N3)-methyltransferase